MKNAHLNHYLTGLLLVVALSSKAAGKQPVTPVPFGDPFILLYEGTYYAYGTHSTEGIEVFTSDDLLTWSRPSSLKDGLALRKVDVNAERWYWAPEVYQVNGKFYMYYSGDEHIWVATSDSPLGPFLQTEKEPLISGEKCIDNSLFRDDDGKAYLFFDRFNDGLNIWVAELSEDLVHLKKETMHPCIHVSQPWEEIWPRVNEGAFVIKHNRIYYMTYSANSYESPYYGLGCATTSNLMGTWTKYESNPIFQKPGNLVGVGHSAFFTDKESNLRIVFHAHKDSANIHPRAMHIGTARFEKQVGADRLVIDSTFLTPNLIMRK